MDDKQTIKKELSKISKTLSNTIDHKKGGYLIPPDYTEATKSELKSLSAVPAGNMPYKIPENYFTHLSQITRKNTLDRSTTTARNPILITLWNKPIVRGIAASVLILLGIWSIVDTPEDLAYSVDIELAYLSENLDDISYASLYSYDLSDEDPLLTTDYIMDDSEESLIDNILEDLSEDELIELL